MILFFKSLYGRDAFRRYFFNTSWLIFEKILRIFTGLFVGIWVARYLGPEQFGLLSYAQSFVFLFSATATLGLDAIVTRELIKDQSKRDILLGTAFFLKLFAAVITILLLFLIVRFTINDYYSKSLVMVIASAMVFHSFYVIDFYFRSKVLAKFVVFSQLISLCVSSLIKIAFILCQASLMAFAVIVIFDSFVLSMSYIFFYKNYRLEIKLWKFDKETAYSLLRDSWPLIFSGIAISFYMRIDQVMIKEMLSSEAVGQYAVAVKLSEVWLFITVAVTNSLYPAIVNAKKKSEYKYKLSILNLYRLLVLLSISISLLIFFSSKQIVLITFGNQYSQSITLLQLYVWSIIFVFLNNASWNWYITENLQRLATIKLFIGAFLNIILNYLFIKRYGLIGAVYATLVSYSFSTYFGNLLFKKTFENFVLQTKALYSFYKIKGFINDI